MAYNVVQALVNSNVHTHIIAAGLTTCIYTAHSKTHNLVFTGYYRYVITSPGVVTVCTASDGDVGDSTTVTLTIANDQLS